LYVKKLPKNNKKQNKMAKNGFVFRKDVTHFRSAMLFGNRKIYFRGSYQFSVVTKKNISPQET